MNINQKYRNAQRLGLGAFLVVLLTVFGVGYQAKPPQADPLSRSGIGDPRTDFDLTLANFYDPNLRGDGRSWQLAEGGVRRQIHEQVKFSEDAHSDDMIAMFKVAGESLLDCASCHKEDVVLPASHPPTIGMSLNTCRTCHVPDGALSLVGKLSLGHTHILSGVGCASCHGDTDPPEDPGTALCLTCHGPLEALAATTAGTEPTNPHSSPHGPPFAECSLYHLQHEPSENFCSSCHDFEFDLP